MSEVELFTVERPAQILQGAEGEVRGPASPRCAAPDCTNGSAALHAHHEGHPVYRCGDGHFTKVVLASSDADDLPAPAFLGGEDA